MADQKLELEINCDASGAITSIEQVTRAEEELTGANEKAGISFTELNQALELAQKAWTAVSAAAQASIAVISEGSAIGDVTESFEKMSGRAGELSSVLLDDLRKATGGTIDDLTLMREELEAVRAGATPDEFEKLAEAARVLAEETGGNLTDELDQLSRAFETGQTRMLKNKLGVIDLEQAEDKLAAQLGITREQLSKEGQVAAARNAIMEASTRKTAEFGKVTDDSGDALARISAAITNAMNRFKLAIGTNDELNQALQRLADIIGRIDFKPIVDGLAKVATWAGTALEKVLSFGEYLGNKFSSDTITVTEKVLDFNGKLVEITRTIPNVHKEVEKLNTVMYGPGNDGGAAEFREHQRIVNENYINQAAAAEKAAEATAKLKKEMDELDAAIAGSEMLGPGNFEGAEQSAMEQAQAQAQFEQSLASHLSSVISVLKSGGSGRDIAGGLGSIGGSILGEHFGGPVGEVIGAELGEALGKGVIDGFDHAFGGNRDAAHRARNSVNEFFHDVLEDASLRIGSGDGLSILDAINFDESSIKAGDWANALNSASAAVQEGFGGAGLAFQQLLEIGEEIGPQIGGALFDSVGGSLNDLQLIVQETGFSLDQMKESVVDAFKSGEITAAQAASSFRGLEEVFTQGIPGAVGATGQAFENLKKGGINSLDALGDLGAELREKFPGVTLTLEDLRAELIAQGKPIEDIDALFTAFAQNGVDNLQELIDIGDELAVNVLANLQSSTSSFGEALSKTAEDIESISDQLNQLDGKSVDIDLNYRVNVSGDEIPSGAPGNPE